MFVFAVLVTGLLAASASAADVKWDTAPDGMPYCKVQSTDDAAFLLGNYRIKVNTHSDGIYELMSGERCWARFNADPARLDLWRETTLKYGNY